jgi:hypothetical protein
MSRDITLIRTGIQEKCALLRARRFDAGNGYGGRARARVEVVLRHAGILVNEEQKEEEKKRCILAFLRFQDPGGENRHFFDRLKVATHIMDPHSCPGTSQWSSHITVPT